MTPSAKLQAVANRLCGLRGAPVFVTFVLALALLVPAALHHRAQHGDETQYGWAAEYYGHKLAHLDFSRGPGDFRHPGWNPNSYWTNGSNFGTFYIYAGVLGITGERGPRLPFSFTDSRLQGRETKVPTRTLTALRLAAALCAAFGLALIARRLRWKALVAAALFLSAPNVPGDLTRAWAEGPLLLGFGLCAVAFGTRWFGLVCGAATTFKLTALGLWPLILLRGANGRRSRLKGVLLAGFTWAVLTPPSWRAGGPLFLIDAGKFRASQFEGQSISAWPDVHAGIFLPSRYLLQFELVAALGLALALGVLVGRIRIGRAPLSVPSDA